MSDRTTDRPTDRPTDTVAYRDARTHLKKKESEKDGDDNDDDDDDDNDGIERMHWTRSTVCCNKLLVEKNPTLKSTLSNVYTIQ